MTTVEELQQKIEREGHAEIPMPEKGQSLVSTLNDEFQKVIMPSWLLLIILESGLVTTFLGISLYFNSPLVLVSSGLIQAIPVAFILLRRIYRVNNQVARKRAKEKNANTLSQDAEQA